MIQAEFHHTSGWITIFELDHVEEAFALLITHVSKSTPGYPALQFSGRLIMPPRQIGDIMLPEEKYPTRTWIIPAEYLRQCTISISTISNEAS